MAIQFTGPFEIQAPASDLACSRTTFSAQVAFTIVSGTVNSTCDLFSKSGGVQPFEVQITTCNLVNVFIVPASGTYIRASFTSTVGRLYWVGLTADYGSGVGRIYINSPAPFTGTLPTTTTSPITVGADVM